MCIGRDHFEQAARRFVALHPPSLYNLRLESVDKECRVKFSLDKPDGVRVDVVLALSLVYGVPQIYFRAFQHDRLMQSVDAVRGLLGSMETFAEGAYQSAIGIDYDPSDGLACFFVHPCRVQGIMEEMPALAPADYLWSFWNVYHL